MGPLTAFHTKVAGPHFKVRSSYGFPVTAGPITTLIETGVNLVNSCKMANGIDVGFNGGVRGGD